MKARISTKAKTFARSISPVRQIMSYADSHYIRSLGIAPEDLVSYAGGWVNHRAPEELRLAYQQIVSDEGLFHKSGAYPHTLGNADFKKAVIEFERHVYGMDNLDTGQIAVGLGSTQLAMDLFDVLLDPGDGILLLDPSYCNYPTQAVTGVLDVKILRFPVLDEATWEYRADARIAEFHEYILTHRPKIILLISPDNPTSQIVSDQFIQAALNAATEIGSFVVVDFAYKELVFSPSVPKYFSWGPTDHFIALRSNSKWCRGLGRRLGWVEAPSYVIESIESIQSSSILCPDMLHQMAMTSYITQAIQAGTLLPYLGVTRRLYETAARHMTQSIRSHLAFPVLEPEGGLFTCMNVGKDGAAFVQDVLKNTGVLVVPGWGFGRTVKNAVRVSYGPLVNDLAAIDRGFAKIAEYLRS